MTVSREAGAGGSAVIERAAQLLQLATIDRELLDYLAEHYRLPRDMLDVCDERTCNWLVESVGIWLSIAWFRNPNIYAAVVDSC